MEETLGDGEGVIRSGDGRNGEEGMTPDGDEESAGNGVGNDTAEDTDGGGVTGDAADRDAVRDAGTSGKVPVDVEKTARMHREKHRTTPEKRLIHPEERSEKRKTSATTEAGNCHGR